MARLQAVGVLLRVTHFPDLISSRAVGEGTPADWALECARSCRVVYDWAKPGDDIDEGFLREHGALPVDQALRGAYRLARVLNDLFDN